METHPSSWLILVLGYLFILVSVGAGMAAHELYVRRDWRGLTAEALSYLACTILFLGLAGLTLRLLS